MPTVAVSSDGNGAVRRLVLSSGEASAQNGRGGVQTNLILGVQVEVKADRYTVKPADAPTRPISAGRRQRLGPA